MQNKTAIWVFAILLTLACVYQLSFTWVASSVEEDAKKEADFKIDSVMDVNPEISAHSIDTLRQKFENEYLQKMGGQPVYPVLGWTYRQVQRNQLNKGLDLQGGMNVTLEVSVIDVIKALSGNSQDPVFLKALKRAVQMQSESRDDFVTLFGIAFKEVDPNAKLAAIFHTYENKDKIPHNAKDEEVLEIISQEAMDAISRTEQVIRKRIDNLGVVQPKVQRLESGRIIVELPGVKDKRRVRKILQGTAKLEFWETYENTEVYPKLREVNDILVQELKLKEKQVDSDTAVVKDTTLVVQNESLKIDTSNEAMGIEDLLAEEGADTTAVLEKENPFFSLLFPSYYVKDNSQFLSPGPVVGYAQLSDTAKVRKILSRKDVVSLFPRTKFFWNSKPNEGNANIIALLAIKTPKDGRAPIEGDVVTDARSTSDLLGNPEVELIMNSEGAKTWKLMTKENIGKSVAIVLDNYVYSFPTVQSEIGGGRTSISGSFTLEETQDLSSVLKAGKLPAPAKIIEEAVVGPTLGAKNIENGLLSFTVGLLIILAYMIFYYARAGAVANVALVVNMFFIMGVLASLGATLTLPGIAGIVLTIGMSVDANVLIFERIREEIAEGKGLRLALVDGYKNAYSSIIDANITTLLTGIILFIFGTGPIKGFATTLIIGICTSLFSAIFITRLIFEWQLSRNKALTFSTKLTQGAFKKINIGFVVKRKTFYFISTIIIVGGLVSLFTRGLNAGIDFSGGRYYIVQFFDQTADVDKLAGVLENEFVSADGIKLRPEVKTFGSSNQVKITTNYLIDNDGENAEQMVEDKLTAGLGNYGGSFEILSSSKVGKSIADDFAWKSAMSIVFSFIVIFLYILIRFKKWQFGVAALVAVFHDVLVVLGVFSIFYGILPFSLEIDQAFIAAILTVVGYSINDTVVVFDRIREYLGRYKRDEKEEVINRSLNSTLSRTINTSLSTFFVLLMIFIFGGEMIRGFVFALMVGVVVGTYSSLCVATPIVVDLDKDKGTGKK